ncbi:MAG: hypothetical protein M1816_007521 [Peltula sp. TS41687]|nr:MAG: hypothetical protein M1816_007521 [Peltula sp. TS41687]
MSDFVRNPPRDPNSSDLLPPLLVCLHAGSSSNGFPSALNDLITPILRQRIKLLYDAPPFIQEHATENGSWIYHLCWDVRQAKALGEIFFAKGLQLHPSTGKVMYEEPGRPMFRRLDRETLEACFTLKDLGLKILYTWCPDDHEGPSCYWKMSELLPCGEGRDEHGGWWPTMAIANGVFFGRQTPDYGRIYGFEVGLHAQIGFGQPDERMQDEGEDAAYWNRYDDITDRPSHPAGSPPLPYDAARAGPAPAAAAEKDVVQTEQDEPAAQEASDDSVDRDHYFDRMMENIARRDSVSSDGKVTRSISIMSDVRTDTEKAIEQHIVSELQSMREYFNRTVYSLENLGRKGGMPVEYFEYLLHRHTGKRGGL